MKGSFCNAMLISLLLLLPIVASARHIGGQHAHHKHQHPSSTQGITPEIYEDKRRMPPMKQRKPDTVQVAGSSLPDCSHACGSCSPCKLVMVSFTCASIEEAETCPMAYKCMCKNKSYPVP